MTAPEGHGSVPAPAREAVARVLSNRQLIPGIFEIALALPAKWGPAQPGQFVQLACPPLPAFGLRRPFSLAACDVSAERVEARIVYGAIGLRTRELSQAPPGSRLPLLGPLGRPFAPPAGRRAVLLGGGRGLAPVLMLAERLRRDVDPRKPRRDAGSDRLAPGAGREPALLLHGARTASQLLPLPDPPCPVRLATDDGSEGLHGTLIDLLQSLLDSGEIREGRDALYACGPNRMLAALAAWTARRDLPCQVSLETHFGCGLGICAGCAVPVRAQPGVEASAFERFAFLCREGPVMDAQRVDWTGVPE